MFIVVAIVIFGIFIGLAYTVFGSEGLSNDLKGLFNTGTEQALIAVKPIDRDNLIRTKDLKQHGGLVNHEYFTVDKDTLTLTSDGTDYVGVRVPSEHMKADTEYKFSFTMKKLEGTISYIGGHMAYSDHTKIYIDGVLVSDYTLEQINSYLSNWYYGLPFKADEKEHVIDVYFNTNGYNDPNNPFNMSEESFRSMFIQPNRGNFGESYTVELSNIALYEQVTK